MESGQDAADVSPAGAALSAGRVGSPHGLDGSFHVTRAVPALLNGADAFIVDGAVRDVARRAGHDRRPILKLAGCETRADADSLRGSELLVGRNQAPALDADEWWADDLEGLLVRDRTRVVGRVQRLLALPSCEVLEVVWIEEDREPLLVPLVSDAVRAVDIEAGEIDIDLAFLDVA